MLGSVCPSWPRVTLCAEHVQHGADMTGAFRCKAFGMWDETWTICGLSTMPATSMIIVCRLVEQDKWARQQAAGNSSGIWAAIGPILDQLDGLLAGYNARAAAAAAEVEDLRAASAAEAAKAAAGTGACSSRLWCALPSALARKTACSGWRQLLGGSGGDGSSGSGKAARRLTAAEARQPLPLSRADLLMVSAVGELLLDSRLTACRQ